MKQENNNFTPERYVIFAEKSQEIQEIIGEMFKDYLEKQYQETEKEMKNI